MPYLRVTCPELSREHRRTIAAVLTEAINDLFYSSNGRLTREELRERTTIHFLPYLEAELFIGGKIPKARTDVTVELSDWNMTVRQQRKIARSLTYVLANLFQIPPEEMHGINIRFHPYPPTDLAVGGRLMSDIISPMGRLMKRVFRQ